MSVRFAYANLALLLTANLTSVIAAPSIRNVDCGSPANKLAQELEKAEPGDTLRIKGTCVERVTITTDRLTLEGDGAAILDGGGPSGGSFTGVVRVEGARGVVLKGLTVRNGSNGIIGQAGATLAVKNLLVEDNSLGGVVAYDSSTVEVADSTIRRNQFGMDVVNNSVAVFMGLVAITNNKGTGIETNGGAALEVRGGTLQANANGGDGILVSNSRLSLLGFPESQGKMITASGNIGNGIRVGGGQVLVVGTAFPPGSFSITVSGNGMSGVFMGGLSLLASPFGTLKLVAENNAVGLTFGTGSGAVLIGGLTIRNNDTGLLADGAGPLTLVSIPPNPSMIQNNNTVDVDLRFGTRSTINGVTIGNVKCDATVLSRGTTTCP